MDKQFIYDRNGKKYIYNRYDVLEITEQILSTFPTKENHKGYKYDRTCYSGFGTKHASYYINLYCGFDIETTRCKTNDNSFMYVWNFSINNNVITGRTWEQFLTFLDLLKTTYQYNDKIKLCVWVANLGYEYQYIRTLLNITDSFFKKEREPVYVVHDNFIYFREALSFGGSLAKLAKEYTTLKKFKGDLDYSVYRTSTDNSIYPPLTNKELKYCDFDVLILAEFSKYMFNTFFSKHINPLTMTATLREQVKNYIRQHSDLRKYYKYINSKYPSREEYNYVMNFVYRGGYVHGNINYVGQLFTKKDNIFSFDITSSYPASIFLCYFPRHFVKYYNQHPTLDEFKYLLNNCCVSFTARFTGLKSKNGHSIESMNKCLEYYDTDDCSTIIDNGRILQGNIVVALTELDFENYQRFYTWDSMQIWDIYTSDRILIPRCILEPMLTSYLRKQELKTQGENYYIEKTYVNSFYGMLVCRLVERELLFNQDTHQAEKTEELTEWDKLIKKPLFYFWLGVYVSAHSRHKLLQSVADLTELGIECLYCDTDSVKFFEQGNIGRKYFEEFNKKEQEKTKIMCDKYNLDYSFFYDLGSYEQEYNEPFETFKYLGAKRYLYTVKKGKKRVYNCTVAGLPKQWYYQNNAQNLMQFYKHFKDGYIAKNCKLASIYNDTDCYDDNGLEIPTNITLTDTDFTLGLNSEWVDLIEDIQNDKYEHRLW